MSFVKNRYWEDNVFMGLQKYHSGAYAETIRHIYNKERLMKICVLSRGVCHLKSRYCDFSLCAFTLIVPGRTMPFIDQLHDTSSSACRSMTVHNAIYYGLQGRILGRNKLQITCRTDGKCIRTQDKSYTTLHRRYEINALQAHCIKCYFRKGLISEIAAFF
jgi:hypothetical protein